MKIFLALVASMLVALTLACSSESEKEVSTTSTQSTSTPASVVTPSPSPIASQIFATPVPTATPEPTVVPTRTPPLEPDSQQIDEVTAIYQTLPELPDNGKWRIVWTGEPAIGMFQVLVIDPPTNVEFVAWFEEAKEWFRNNGQDPCKYPLTGLIGYTSTGPYPPQSTEDPWEPCKDN